MSTDVPLGTDPHFDYKNNILKNFLGFAHQEELDKFERIEGATTIFDLQKNPVEGRFDVAHMREIHTWIFQNIYPWAGEFRQVNIRRSESYFFALVQFMEQNLNDALAKLTSENRLKGLAVDAFASRSAYYLGELNAVHPFRDGNGRVQREFIRQLAVEAGYRINWGRVTREQMYEASIESHSLGKNAAFTRLIGISIEP